MGWLVTHLRTHFSIFLHIAHQRCLNHIYHVLNNAPMIRSIKAGWTFPYTVPLGWFNSFSPTWACVKRTRRFRRCERGKWSCCLVSMPHVARPVIWDGMLLMLLLWPRIRLLTA